LKCGIRNANNKDLASEIHFQFRIPQLLKFVPSPLGDCVIIGRGGMNEEASAGEDGILRVPANIRKEKADSKDCRIIKVLISPRSMEKPLPYDSERMPSRPVPRLSHCDTAS
jgi:hypothetical protein